MSSVTFLRFNPSNLMPLEKPHFQSNLPEFLTQDISPKEKYILESLSVISQNNSWLVEETIKQSNKLEDLGGKVTQVDDKLKFTNGKIANSMLQIKALEDKNASEKERDEEVEKIVAFKKFVGKYLLNRYAVGLFVILGVGVFKVLTTPEILELFMKIVGL